MSDMMRISLDEALALALEQTPVLPEEWAGLQDARGRILTQDICAAIDQPPFPRSPLDGYALLSTDTRSASKAAPVTLRVMSRLVAPQTSNAALHLGEAVHLMTGCMIPEGADCVIRQEDTERGEGFVRIFQEVSSGSNYCPRGEEYRAGDKILARGTKVDAAAVAVAAGSGLIALPVNRKACAAIISTGNELCVPGQPLTAGKIYDSNVAYLTAKLRQLDVIVARKISVGDECSLMTAALEDCGQVDLILTTGGVSAGEQDLLGKALSGFGAEILFHGVDIKPGMPTLLAKRESTLILGLSGNPFSAAVPLELLLRPILCKMTRDDSLLPRRSQVTAAALFGKASPTRRFLGGYSDGRTVSIPAVQSNSQMKGLVGCNCLLDIPAGTESVSPGDSVSVLWI